MKFSENLRQIMTSGLASLCRAGKLGEIALDVYDPDRNHRIGIPMFRLGDGFYPFVESARNPIARFFAFMVFELIQVFHRVGK